MSNREVDLGRVLGKTGRRLEDEGQFASQRFADWERTERIPQTGPACIDCDGMGIVGAVRCVLCKGTGDAAPTGGNPDGKLDRDASRLRKRWNRALREAARVAQELDTLMAVAKVPPRITEKNRLPGHVEADGWCGNHWSRLGVLEPITLRPTGEPYYKGRCRFCGAWPEGDPPLEVLRARLAGKAVRVAAS